MSQRATPPEKRSELNLNGRSIFDAWRRDLRTRRRRRMSRKESEALFSVVFYLGFYGAVIYAIFAIFAAALSFIKDLLQNPFGIAGLIFVAVGFSFAAYRRIQKIHAEQEELDARIAEVEVSTDRGDYVVSNEDYRRGNSSENLYRKVFKLTLLEKYANRCAKCGDQNNGVDLDHFVFSKNEGGNFVLRHKLGHLVNNAIPLCATCNRKKSDDSFLEFFDVQERLRLFQINSEMSKLINDKLEINDQGKLVKRNHKEAV